MKKHLRFAISFKWLILLTLFGIPSVSISQSLKDSDFVLFANNIQIGTSSTISGGSVGANVLVSTSGNLSLTGNIYSGGTVSLGNNNMISGKITAANKDDKIPIHKVVAKPCTGPLPNT